MLVGILVTIFFILLLLATIYFGVIRVEEGEVAIVERLTGEYQRVLEPGIHFIIPFFEFEKKYLKCEVRDEKTRKCKKHKKVRISTKDINIDIPPQNVITKDNANIEIDTIAFIKVSNPAKAIYEVDDYEEAVEQLILSSIRSIFGRVTLDEALDGKIDIKMILPEQESKIVEIVDALKIQFGKTTPAWGVTVTTFEIQSITPEDAVKRAMDNQLAAEKEAMAIKTLADANKEKMIREAEGELRSAELEAEAQIALARASAESMKLIAESLDGKEFPAMFLLGDRYINSLNELSKSNNSKFVVYPADVQATIKGMLGSLIKK